MCVQDAKKSRECSLLLVGCGCERAARLVVVVEAGGCKECRCEVGERPWFPWARLLLVVCGGGAAGGCCLCWRAFWRTADAHSVCTVCAGRQAATPVPWRHEWPAHALGKASGVAGELCMRSA